MIKYCAFVAVIAFLSSVAFGQQISSCPDFDPGIATQDCKFVNCGDTITNEKVVLTNNLKCGNNQTIKLVGSNALLDCDGYTIQGVGQIVDETKDVDHIVELINGSSVINCNFIMGHKAIVTSGDGCFTINNVTSAYTSRDSISVRSTGTVIMNDIFSTGANKDGINIENTGNRTMFVEINNFESKGDHECGIGFDAGNSNGTLEAKLFGDISITSIEAEGLLVECGNKVEIYGQFSAIGSARLNGINVDGGCDASVTFISGSTGRMCYNNLLDVTDAIVEPGAIVTCDKSNSGICEFSCNDFEAGSIGVCVEDD